MKIFWSGGYPSQRQRVGRKINIFYIIYHSSIANSSVSPLFYPFMPSYFELSPLTKA